MLLPWCYLGFWAVRGGCPGEMGQEEKQTSPAVGAPKETPALPELAAEPAHRFSREKWLFPRQIPAGGRAHPTGGTAPSGRALLWEPLQQHRQWGRLSCGVLLQPSAQQLHSSGSGHTNIPWHAAAGPGRGLGRAQKAQGEVGRVQSHPCLLGVSS